MPTTVSFAADAYTLFEGDANASVRVALDEPSAEPVLVAVNILEDLTNPGQEDLPEYGTGYTWGGSGARHQFTEALVLFNPGETAKDVAIPLVDDDLVQPTQSLLLTLNPPQGGGDYIFGAYRHAKLRIVSNDQPQGGYRFLHPEFAVGEAVGTFTVLVTRDGPTTSAGHVGFYVNHLTPTANSADYSLVTPTGSRHLFFAVGDATEAITVTITPDTLDEPDEEVFELVLVNPVGGTLSTPTRTKIRIADDDLPPPAVPRVRFELANQPDANESSGTVYVNVVRELVTNTTLTVNYTVGGTATPGADYQSLSGSVTFYPGDTTRAIPVTLINDDVPESDETVVFTLVPGAASSAVTPTATTLRIKDNDAPPVVQWDVPQVRVGEGGVAYLAASLSKAVSYTVTVPYWTTSLSATIQDYAATSGTLTFSPGATTAWVTVNIPEDNIPEHAETFLVTLGASSAATLGVHRRALVTIDDNDSAAPQIVILDQSVREDAGSADITVRLTAPYPRPITTGYGTANQTATAGSDYTAASGSLTFNPNEVEKHFTVPVSNDTVVEPDETVLLSANGSNYGNWVAQMYSDLHARQAEAGGYAFWVNHLLTGSMALPVAAAGILNSTEYLGNVVDEYYQRYLFRRADSGGLSASVQALQTNARREEDVQAALLGSVEYISQRGKDTHAGFLRILYHDVLGREIDPVAYNTYLPQLDSGARSRDQLALQTVTSTEAYTNLVTGFYRKYLRREPDAGGLNGWVNALINPNPSQRLRIRDVIVGFVASVEYYYRTLGTPNVATLLIVSSQQVPKNELSIPVMSGQKESERLRLRGRWVLRQYLRVSFCRGTLPFKAPQRS